MIRFVILLFLAMLIATPAIAARVPLPPVKYDHPYKGKLIERNYDPAGVARACKKFGITPPRGKKIVACALSGMRFCIINMPKKNSESYSLVKRHELGHCNGWRGHANSR